MKPSHIGPTLLAAAATGALLAGCGGGGGDNNATAASPSSTGSSSQPSASGSSDAVTISNFKFSPGTITVKSGTKVAVTNNDSTAHTATSDDGSSFNTGDIDPGSSKTITVSKAGSFSYHCSIHPFMHGKLVVQ
jgi:plastocyanin